MRSSNLLLIKSLTSKIHPQLPLNRRESKQLLQILQTSFRKHLDLQHPPNAPPLEASSNVKTTARAETSRDSAVRHIETVLSNPFLRPTPQSSLRPSHQGTTAEVAIDSTARLIQDPAQWFQERIDDGTANLAAAKLCMEMFVGVKDGNSIIPSAEQIRISGLGSKIHHWMHLRGLEDTVAFHSDRGLSYLLVLCLTAEGQKQFVTHWAINLLEGKAGSLPPSKCVKYGRYLIEALVKALVRLKAPLDTIINDFLYTLNALNGERAREQKLELGTAGRFINKFVIANTNLDEFVYDEWVQSLPETTSDPFLLAQLKLYHPKRPDATPAFEYLMDHASKDFKGLNRRHVIYLCLDTAHQLLKEQKHQDSLSILQLAQKRFPEEFSKNLGAFKPLSMRRLGDDGTFTRPNFSFG